MKKMSWGSLSVLVLSASLLFSACSKAKDGTNGTNGATGTANVMYSPWLDVTYTFNTTDSAYEATIAAPKLVDSILQKGDVRVYWNANTAASPNIYLLPVGDIIISLGAAKINLLAGNNYSSGTISGVKVGQYRYVLIPGGVPTGRMATVDWKNYAAVKAYLGLKD